MRIMKALSPLCLQLPWKLGNEAEDRWEGQGMLEILYLCPGPPSHALLPSSALKSVSLDSLSESFTLLS